MSGVHRSHSPRLLKAMCPFGVRPGDLDEIRAGAAEETERVAGRVRDAVASRRAETPGVVVLLTGPSGSGKSVLLRALEQRVPAVASHRARIDPRRALAEHRASIDLGDWLGVLSRAGLADARLLATPAGRLSDGERARLRLALGMAAVERDPGRWLLADECCTALDRDTASGVAASLRRWVDRSGACVVAASAHADLERLLGPDLVVRCRPDGPAAIERGTGRARGPAVRVEPGMMADHAALAAHHYRRGRPALPCRVLRAVVRGERGERLAGVLVVTHPTLNGSWRDLIWPGRYTGSDTRRTARRLNRELRRISRVIVDPRDRGRGVARILVRAYLDEPVTPATEAVAAMGRLSPFGRSAGMTAYPLSPRPADDRLADVLASAGAEPWVLLDEARAGELLRDPFVRGEVERWGRSVWSSVPKPVRARATAAVLAPLAAARLCAPPIAYGHVSDG